METNKLSKEELNLIANMDERLKKLETLLDEALAKETPETLTQWLLSKRSIAPIEQVEEVKKVVALVSDCGWKNSQRIVKGEQYDIFKKDEKHYYVNGFGFSKEKFAVLSQQEQPKEEAKWRVGINVCANQSRFDVRVYGIETESQAIELKDKIKALLQTL